MIGVPGPLPGAAKTSAVTGVRRMVLCAGGVGRTRFEKLASVTTRPRQSPS